MPTSTYYFDGHIDIFDFDGAWSNDANGFDGDENTTTYPSLAAKVLIGSGTTASSNSNTITAVRVRSRNSGGFTGWTELAVPSGGWTWQMITEMTISAQVVDMGGLEMWIDFTDTSSSSYGSISYGINDITVGLKKVEIEVEYTEPKGIKVYDGTQFVPRVVKSHNGTDFVARDAYLYNASEGYWASPYFNLLHDQDGDFLLDQNGDKLYV